MLEVMMKRDTTGKPRKPTKRPTDANQLAHFLGKQSTGEASEPSKADISRVMSVLGRRGGKVGGKRRMETMTPEKRSALARLAVQTRWAKKRLEEK